MDGTSSVAHRTSSASRAGDINNPLTTSDLKGRVS
jgi:hypothetical protein